MEVYRRYSGRERINMRRKRDESGVFPMAKYIIDKILERI